MQEQDSDVFLQLTRMMYQLGAIKAKNVIEFINDNIDEKRMDVVYKLIMILLRDGFNRKELANVALHYKDTFSVNLNDVFNTRNEMNSNDAAFHANFLISEGIPKEAFEMFDQSKLTGEPSVPKILSEPLCAVRNDNLNEFLRAVHNRVNSRAPLLAGIYSMTYLSWAALFGSSKVFTALLSKIRLDRGTIKMAIKKGNRNILKTIFATEGIDPHIYMKSLIKHHRNFFIYQIKRVSDINNEELLNVARNNLNFEAFTTLSAVK
jgi:hypothetical protein